MQIKIELVLTISLQYTFKRQLQKIMNSPCKFARFILTTPPLLPTKFHAWDPLLITFEQ